jgi:hypothetical protein
MQRYCIDANVLIQAKNGPYGFDIVPTFWKWLHGQMEAGVIYSSKMVYDELSTGEDELAEWTNDRRTSGFFVEPDDQVQKHFQNIANYVNEKYPLAQVQYFLDGADPWVIAHAKVDKAFVVTHEVLVPDNSSKIKIPNICKTFSVNCINPYEMLRRLKAKL